MRCIAWIIASFLPLPPRVSQINGEATTSRPDLEHAFNSRVVLVDEVRRANARWWRNVNRVMSPVGLVIIAIVVSVIVYYSKPDKERNTTKTNVPIFA